MGHAASWDTINTNYIRNWTVPLILLLIDTFLNTPSYMSLYLCIYIMQVSPRSRPQPTRFWVGLDEVGVESFSEVLGLVCLLSVYLTCFVLFPLALSRNHRMSVLYIDRGVCLLWSLYLSCREKILVNGSFT